MLQLSSSDAWNGIETSSARFLEIIVIELFSRGAADDDMSECFQRWSKSEKFRNAIVERIASNQFFIRPVTGFIKQHVDSTIDKYHLTKLYAETGKMDKTGAPLPPSRSSSDAAKNCKSTLRREGSRHLKSKKEKRSFRRFR